MEARILQVCEKNIQFTVDQENAKFKSSFLRTVDQKVKDSSQKLEVALQKKIKEVADQFQVEDLIGKEYTYYDFKHFAKGVIE